MKIENVIVSTGLIAATALLLKTVWPKGLTVTKQRQSLINRFSEHTATFKQMSDKEIIFSYGWIAVKEHGNKNVINAFLTKSNNAETLTSIQNKYKIFT